MKNPYLKIISLTFILTSTFLLTACIDTKYSDIEMVRINGGTFTMGSDDTADGTGADPAHPVTLTKGFYMGKYQVTQKQWEEVMGTTIEDQQTLKGEPLTSNYGRGDNYPMYYVNWYDAIEFCNRLSIREGLVPVYIIEISGIKSFNPDDWGTQGSAWDSVIMAKGANGYRLPTEAEWEYACRAGTATAYNTGGTISDNTGWHSGNSGSMTHEVGKKPANAWGLYDMHGNVFEMCWDWYGTYPGGAQTDPEGASSGSGRVFRGGSWSGIVDSLRSASRVSTSPSFRDNNVGFRVVHP